MAKEDRIQRFFNEVFRLSPPPPKYNITWDTTRVLDHLSTSYPNDSLSLDCISEKTISLIDFKLAHRIQTISKINIANMEQSNVVYYTNMLKTTLPGSKQPISYLPYGTTNRLSARLNR